MDLSKRKIILIDGPTGAGKTTTSDLLYKKLPKTAFLGRDRIKWFASDFSRLRKRDIMIADRVVEAMCKQYLDFGLSILIEQCFRRKNVVNPYLVLSRKRKIPLLAYELIAPKKILLHRIKHRPYMCAGKNNLPLWRIHKQIAAYPHKHFTASRLKLDSSQLSAVQIANRIFKDIKEA
jgi:adenylate kinase family enzyme